MPKRSKAPKPEAATTGQAAAPATAVVLVRHGLTPTTGRVLPGRASGLHLSEAGNAQAKALAQRFADLQEQGRDNADGLDPEGERHQEESPALGAIYASPLERTSETAAAIGEATGLPVQPEPSLLEMDIGDWTGLTLAEARQRPEWARIQRCPSAFRFPGGESFPEMQARLVAFVERLRSDHLGQVVVAVSHAEPIRVLAAHALGVHLDLLQRIVVSPCSVTTVAYRDTGPTVLALNAPDVTHLTDG